ncbi:MAG: hypothetical protein KGO48_05885 [Alphaproteobacteria bacterium]|nr:hypothetical protein [Alphaproteobacteria bacterium]
MSSFGIAFAPHLPLWQLAAFGGVALLILAFSQYRRAHGAWARILAFAVIMVALANPLIVKETRAGLSNIVALIIDRSQSMEIGSRKADSEKALAALRDKLKTMNVELREGEVRTTADAGDNGGTALFSALNAALSDAPPDRVAGAIVITDGQVHDAPDPKTFHLGAPFHVVLTGAPNERDRKLTVVRATRFNIVGKDAQITFRVDDFGGSPAANAQVSVRVDGQDQGKRAVPVGKDTTISLPITHGGENVVELEAAPGPAEQTLQNNRAAVIVNGVRDRLRVLLVSGEPHAGERVWRNLLKADPSVDLVHFTILRPPDKQDSTPINELALIQFPTRELFAEKLHEFDLVILDRYQNRDILPLAYFDNIARYVENGGALLVSAGPEFADESSIYRTPLAAVLPAEPTGEVITGAFRPQITKAGFAHPVTRDLPLVNDALQAAANAPPGANPLAPGQTVQPVASGSEELPAQPNWGPWFRLIAAQRVAGNVVMSGPGNRPLLVLDRVQKGRVAQLLSDQIWLWARGYENGGPQAELLRRLAHWLMKEPELEEERLTAEVAGGELRVTRQTMADTAPDVTVTTPTGKSEVLHMSPSSPGRFVGHLKAEELGLYRMNDGTLNAVAAAGPLNPREVADMRATDEILRPYANATGGGVQWLSDGLPELRSVDTGATTRGNGWFGIERRGAYRVTSVDSQELLPPWLALIIVLATLLFAWRRESV